MKIKWKIVLSITAFLMLIVVVINLYYYRLITNLVENKVSEELSNYSLIGNSLFNASYPGDWHLDGDTLYKGDIAINDNNEIVDELSSNTGIIATVFAGDTRISTTVKDETGNRKIGTKASEEVVETVLKQGLDYQGSANVAGKNANTKYVPIKDSTGNTVGMWFVGVYTDEIQSQIKKALLSSVGILIFIDIFGIAISYTIGLTISKGFLKIKKDLESIEQGDFRINSNKKLESRKDELGDITRSFHKMQTQIGGIISTIKEETGKIETSSLTLSEGANDVYNHIEDISATTEELSAGMEETAASTEEMNATMAEIDMEVTNVFKMVNNGLEVATEIKSRAERLREAAANSKQNAVDIYGEANKKLRKTIEKASAIEEIRALSKAIMDINAQTNLLALNASIESARAGEAGKGFAVVANEISILAKNSKNAVTKIEEITNDVADVLESMVTDSQYLLDFVDGKVIKDYGTFVQTSEQYHTDANTVDGMVTEIRNFTLHLQESIQYIKQAIDEVSIASNEATKGSVDIADKTTSIFHKTDQVLELSNTNREIAASLNQMVEYFQI